MEKAILDLTECKYLLEMHKRIQTALLFPDHYGNNRDAFWDCMINDTPIEHIEIRGRSKVAPQLESSVQRLCQILEEAKAEREKYGDTLSYEITD